MVYNRHWLKGFTRYPFKTSGVSCDVKNVLKTNFFNAYWGLVLLVDLSQNGQRKPDSKRTFKLTTANWGVRQLLRTLACSNRHVWALDQPPNYLGLSNKLGVLAGQNSNDPKVISIQGIYPNAWLAILKSKYSQASSFSSSAQDGELHWVSMSLWQYTITPAPGKNAMTCHH